MRGLGPLHVGEIDMTKTQWRRIYHAARTAARYRSGWPINAAARAMQRMGISIEDDEHKYVAPLACGVDIASLDRQSRKAA